MNINEPIVLDDPAIHDSSTRLAELCARAEDEAIGIALKAQLTVRARAAAGLDEA